MNKIDKFEVIKREKLDEMHYFQSLVNKAQEKNVLNIEDIQNIQLQILNVLKNRVQLYNGCENSSISIDNAEVIMESNIYTISLYLKTLKPDDAIEELKKSNLQEIYNKGKKIIDIKINYSKELFSRVISNKLNTENETYNLTIIDGIEGFFKIYNPYFEANKIQITADYPLYNNLIGKLDGIEFIEKYLKFIYIENEFCNLFSDEDIKHLLYGYSKEYKDLIINIFEIVLTAVIGCNLANENIKRLTISTGGLQNIYKILLDKSKDDIYDIILKQYMDVRNKLFDKNIELQMYIERNLFQIQYMIYNGVKNNTLDKVFIVEKIIF